VWPWTLGSQALASRTGTRPGETQPVGGRSWTAMVDHAKRVAYARLPSRCAIRGWRDSDTKRIIRALARAPRGMFRIRLQDANLYQIEPVAYIFSLMDCNFIFLIFWTLGAKRLRVMPGTGTSCKTLCMIFLHTGTARSKTNLVLNIFFIKKGAKKEIVWNCGDNPKQLLHIYF